ncbi:MAG: trehalose-phosphatase, partial [bacterium]
KWLSRDRWEVLLAAYARARRRLLLVDYDGTLVEIADRPEQATPDAAVRRLLAQLSADPCNRVVLVSGRDLETLDGWFGDLGVDLVAEHGAWVRDRGGPWEAQVSPQPGWKDKLRPVLEAYAGLTPGAWVEEKTASLAWHFRGVDPALAAVRARELVTTLVQLSGTTPLGILHGKRVVEVRDPAVGKGRAASRWLASVRWEFILAAGDDVTDEELFAVLPEDAHSVRVGFGPTHAAWMVEAPHHLRALLEQLASTQPSGTPTGSEVQ